MSRFSFHLSLIVAAILGGLISQGISRWMPEAQAAQEPKVQDLIRARRIVVLDEVGLERIVMEAGMQEVKVGDKSVKFDSSAITISGNRNAALNHVRLGCTEGMTSIQMSHGLDTPMSIQGSGGAVNFRMGGDGLLKPAPLGLHVTKKGAAAIIVSDEERARAVLGVTETEVIKTGETRVTAPSSLTLFGKDGKVIWQAP